MTDTAKMSAGFVVGLGVGIALYFAVVARLPVARQDQPGLPVIAAGGADAPLPPDHDVELSHVRTEKPKVSRRTFAGGVAAGTLAGAVGTMGVYSYSPWRQRHFSKVEPTRRQIGEVKSVKVTNISETSWFDNKTLMDDIRGAGGLLVNQYTYNWAPFADVRASSARAATRTGVKS